MRYMWEPWIFNSQFSTFNSHERNLRPYIRPLLLSPCCLILCHAESADIRRNIACIWCHVSLARAFDALFPVWVYKNKLLTLIPQIILHSIYDGFSIKNKQWGLSIRFNSIWKATEQSLWWKMESDKTVSGLEWARWELVHKREHPNSMTEAQSANLLSEKFLRISAISAWDYIYSLVCHLTAAKPHH